jgi:hypothetical protein
MAVRRQLKVSKDAISLTRLMTEIADDPHLINRDYWIGLFKGYPIEPLAGEMFDRTFGEGAKHLDPATVTDDLASLRVLAQGVETWGDKRVAHHDAGPEPVTPTFAELDQTLDAISELLKKYYAFVTADAIAYTTPTIQHNWKRVFDLAWAPPRTSSPSPTT